MEAKITAFDGYQYIAYYEANGDVVVARKAKAPSGSWEKSVVSGYTIKSQDRHNKIALSVSAGDGVIHLSFNHHNSPSFKYVHSKPGVATQPENVVWDDTVFELQPNLGLTQETGLITYPSFYQLDATGDLLMYWRTGRAIKGEMNLAHYDSKIHEWSLIGQISNATGSYRGIAGTRGPYHSGFMADQKGNLHVSWIWREIVSDHNVPDVLGNEGLYFASSPGGGFIWQDSEGKQVSNSSTGMAICIDTMGKPPVEIPLEQNPTNVGFTAVMDTVNSNYMALINQYEKGTTTRKNHLYTRTSTGKWSIRIMEVSGEGKLELLGNQLLFINTEGLFIAKRKDGFRNWEQIKFSEPIEAGEANWDLSGFGESQITMALQHEPERLGQPSPIEVLVLRMGGQ